MLNKPEISIDEILLELQAKFGRKELSFGCDCFVKIGTSTEEKPRFAQFIERLPCTSGSTGNVFYVGKDIIPVAMNLHKIIGHPLTLNDIFYSMNNNNKLLGYSARPFYTCSMQIEIRGKILFKWNLDSNLLRDQDDKTIRLIYKLLR